MVWIALGLLALAATFVLLVTLADRWGMGHFRWTWQVPTPYPPSKGLGSGVLLPPEPNGKKPPQVSLSMIPTRTVVSTFRETAKDLGTLPHVLPGPLPALALGEAVATASNLALGRTGFFVFSNWIVFSVFVGFLLPLWSLSFATDAIGGERENRSLVWLLTRPMSRPAIYLAKFVAVLPWSLVLNLGGFALLCALAGNPGRLAFTLYGPAVFGATLAFCALFHFMAACFRRPAVVALVYSFFLETILGSMPGYMKRISISFYTRCLMFDAAQDYSVYPDKPSVYLPVDAPTAWSVLLGVSAVMLLAGMVVFARAEYQDVS
jgi:ABC-type transport system involved in multi-copper enzyme maturation permease subunit